MILGGDQLEDAYNGKTNYQYWCLLLLKVEKLDFQQTKNEFSCLSFSAIHSKNESCQQKRPGWDGGSHCLNRLVELTRLKLATTRKEEKERSMLSPSSRIPPLHKCWRHQFLHLPYNHCHHHWWFIILIIANHDYHRRQQTHHPILMIYAKEICHRLLRGVDDPDIVVKRPAENPGGMTVTIFKVRIRDGVKIIRFSRILSFQ